MSKFEFISKYKDCGLPLPERKTELSAGYDLVAAEDIVIPSYQQQMTSLSYRRVTGAVDCKEPVSLDEMANITKQLGYRPTLIPTGLKCKLNHNSYLELSVRSSTPLKYWLVLANGVGIIDADYYNNPDNEGHIYLQVINLSPIDILVKKGEAIGQGIIKPYLHTENDAAAGLRTGGFGSTTK